MPPSDILTEEPEDASAETVGGELAEALAHAAYSTCRSCSAPARTAVRAGQLVVTVPHRWACNGVRRPAA
jgi:hypothetical protein